MKTISFDIGGVIDANPKVCREVILELKKEGYRIIIVTAISDNPIMYGPYAEGRRWFSIGRLYSFGLRRKIDYDECLTVLNPDNGKKTGYMKDGVLRTHGVSVHVDDNEEVMSNIKYCPCVKFDPGMDIKTLIRAIEDLEG